ncbi:hypothetical protein MBOU_46000 [Mycobacterium bourgelatii]|uniref:Uncharacterized protein n=1 Tax=Mycobacterium bourgelatii TaxID=1273442 RepID=A0A7I9YVB3_MYCBU|nr:hypothetical protein MBOU_46000 [Mycobacterium bourgelatii]
MHVPVDSFVGVENVNGVTASAPPTTAAAAAPTMATLITDPSQIQYAKDTYRSPELMHARWFGGRLRKNCDVFALSESLLG